VLDSGTEQYYIIIHDNGLLELAVMQDGSFKSALATNFAGYNLQNPNNELNIEVTRSFDEVKVYVGTTLYLSFNVTPQSAKVYLTSEHSISKFSEIEMSQSAAVRLFAVRQNLVTPSYTVQQRNPEASALTVFSNGADFAVVSQYLYNQLTHADSRVSSNEIAANVFFKGWVFASSNQTSNSINISITMDNRAIELSLLSFSITFSYAAILLLLAPAKVKSALWKQLNRIKAKKIVGSKTK
jgi:hypothetical protein